MRFVGTIQFQDLVPREVFPVLFGNENRLHTAQPQNAPVPIKKFVPKIIRRRLKEPSVLAAPRMHNLKIEQNGILE